MNLSSEEFVLGVEPDIEISMSSAIPKTNSSELRLLSGRLTLYTLGRPLFCFALVRKLPGTPSPRDPPVPGTPSPRQSPVPGTFGYSPIGYKPTVSDAILHPQEPLPQEREQGEQQKAGQGGRQRGGRVCDCGERGGLHHRPLRRRKPQEEQVQVDVAMIAIRGVTIPLFTRSKSRYRNTKMPEI